MAEEVERDGEGEVRVEFQSMVTTNREDIAKNQSRVSCPEHGVTLHECWELHNAVGEMRESEIEYLRLPCGDVIVRPVGVSAKVTCGGCGRKWGLKLVEGGKAWNAWPE